MYPVSLLFVGPSPANKAIIRFRNTDFLILTSSGLTKKGSSGGD
jgi:hypothetical protein